MTFADACTLVRSTSVQLDDQQVRVMEQDYYTSQETLSVNFAVREPGYFTEVLCAGANKSGLGYAGLPPR